MEAHPALTCGRKRKMEQFHGIKGDVVGTMVTLMLKHKLIIIYIYDLGLNCAAGGSIDRIIATKDDSLTNREVDDNLSKTMSVTIVIFQLLDLF